MSKEADLEKTNVQSFLKNFILNSPGFNEDSCQCLSCGRIVLCGGPCCDNPVYCEPEDHYRNYNVTKTDEDHIFMVENQSGDQYFVIEDQSGILSNTMWRTKELAIKNRN